MRVSPDQLEEVYGKRHLSYSSLKYALGDMTLWDMYMRGQLKKESEALSFGTLYDTLLFDRQVAMNNFIVLDEKRVLEETGSKAKTNSKYIARMEELRASLKEGQQFVSPEDWKQANEMIDRLTECGLVDLRFSGDYQVPINVSLHGIPIKGFVDCLNVDSIVDSKTTKSIKSFKYSVYDFGYDIQAYIYCSVFDMPRFYWVAQEKTFPYLPADIKCSDEVLFSGEMRFETAVGNIQKFLNDENAKKNPRIYYETFTV